MANRMPSMLALLSLAAIAGYQNRDKIAGALEGLKSRVDGAGSSGQGGPGGGLLAGLGDLLGGTGNNGLAGGLGDLLNSFRSAGHGAVADSWVKPGVPTQGLSPSQVEQAIGSENLAELSTRTGLSREDLLQRLATAIPETVDRITPNGQLPTSDDEVRQRLL